MTSTPILGYKFADAKCETVSDLIVRITKLALLHDRRLSESDRNDVIQNTIARVLEATKSKIRHQAPARSGIEREYVDFRSEKLVRLYRKESKAFKRRTLRRRDIGLANEFVSELAAYETDSAAGEPVLVTRLLRMPGEAFVRLMSTNVAVVTSGQSVEARETLVRYNIGAFEPYGMDVKLFETLVAECVEVGTTRGIDELRNQRDALRKDVRDYLFGLIECQPPTCETAEPFIQAAHAVMTAESTTKGACAVVRGIVKKVAEVTKRRCLRLIERIKRRTIGTLKGVRGLLFRHPTARQRVPEDAGGANKPSPPNYSTSAGPSVVPTRLEPSSTTDQSDTAQTAPVVPKPSRTRLRCNCPQCDRSNTIYSRPVVRQPAESNVYAGCR